MPESLRLAYDLSRAVLLVWTLWAVARNAPATWPRRSLTVGVILAHVAYLAWTYQLPYDFKRFWQVGADIFAGVDYYRLDPKGDRQLILNPPTIVPLFEAWALLPLRSSAIVWTGLNASGAFVLVPLAYLALLRQGTIGRLSPATLGLLATVVGVSCASGMGLALGQVSLLAVVAIVCALWAQAANRPWLAGLGLAVATIKINTMIPFLTLFLRRKDLTSWISLGITCTGLCLISGPLSELPHRCETTLQTIRGTFEPGRVNDYGDLGDSHASLIGIDQALYRLGLRDRRLISGIQTTILAGLLLAMAIRAKRSDTDRANSCALAALVASLFFYHRVYDELILVLPMLVGALRFASSNDRSQKRAWFAVFALALLVMFISPDGLRLIHAQTDVPGLLPVLVRGLMLPLGIWIICGALGFCWRASSNVPDTAKSIETRRPWLLRKGTRGRQVDVCRP